VEQKMLCAKQHWFQLKIPLPILLAVISEAAAKLLHTLLIVLTLNLLTTIIVAPRSNANKWQMGFNLVFKGLIV
jgi:hypothetical protein